MAKDQQQRPEKQVEQSSPGPGDRVVKDVTITVMSSPHKRPTYPRDETLRDASLQAIKATKQGPSDLKKWELKSDDGRILDFGKTFAEAGIDNGATLRLTRKAGTVA